MDKTIMTFSGRNFTSEEIDLIKWTRKRDSQLSRTELARTICEFLGWTTPAGRGKTPQCTSFLEKLEEEGLIELPPLDVSKIRSRNLKVPDVKINTTPITGELKDLLPIHLEIARAGIDLKLWRQYISKNHMLGDKQVFGSQLAYFIKSNETFLAVFSFRHPHGL